MKEYHKIQTVYLRDPDNNHKTLLDGEYAKPEFETLKDILWVLTEKIDGTNIRIMWDGSTVTFGGKTDKAAIPSFLLKTLQETFTPEKMKVIFHDMPDNPSGYNICLYGEGYGHKIQKDGDDYNPDKADFIWVDCRINNELWVTRECLISIAGQLEIEIVPIIGFGTLSDAVDLARKGFKSEIAHNKDYVAEGLIMKPSIELGNRMGARIITKIKYKDFPRENGK